MAQTKEQAHTWYLKNKERRKAITEKNKVHVAAVKHAYYLKNKEKRKASDKAYVLANLELVRARQRKYYKAHRESALAGAKAWRERYPHRVKKNSRSYRESHIEEHRVDGAKRRAMKAKAPIGSFTGKDWTEMKAAYGYRCVYCQRKKPLTQDHVIPLVKGGMHGKSIIVPACQSCNSRKSARLAPPFQPVLYAV